jgi:hypothetical protein
VVAATAYCLIIQIPGMPAPKCTVHEHPSPCPHNTKPASPIPMSVMSQPNRQVSVAGARNLTRGERPIAVHNGCEGDPGHFGGERPAACWCGPEIIPPS